MPAWAKEKGMRTFLSVAAGSEQPAKFVEIIYKGASGSGSDATDVAFVGKGITFDSGGISLKPGADMKVRYILRILRPHIAIVCAPQLT